MDPLRSMPEGEGKDVSKPRGPVLDETTTTIEGGMKGAVGLEDAKKAKAATLVASNNLVVFGGEDNQIRGTVIKRVAINMVALKKAVRGREAVVVKGLNATTEKECKDLMKVDKATGVGREPKPEAVVGKERGERWIVTEVNADVSMRIATGEEEGGAIKKRKERMVRMDTQKARINGIMFHVDLLRSLRKSLLEPETRGFVLFSRTFFGMVGIWLEWGKGREGKEPRQHLAQGLTQTNNPSPKGLKSRIPLL